MNLEEVARLAGVSRSTVSRVVNDDRRVSDDVRRRVQEVIRAHNYHPNAAARSLASRRMRIIGLLVSKAVWDIFSDPFYPRLIQGTAEGCNDVDHNLTMLIDSSRDGSAVDQLYRRVIRGRHVDGVIIACHVVDDPIVTQLKADKFPFVLVGRHPREEISYIDVDNRDAARQAVAHLLDHGYHRIAAICGPRNLIASIDRYAGYVTALQEAGVPPDPSLAIFADFTQRGAARAMQELIHDRGSPPDAVFVASDSMAFGVLHAIKEAGLRVPEDIAVMGFDGLADGAHAQPPLSTVYQPMADLGREAVRVLLERIEQPETPPVQRFLPTRLLLRRSCGCESSVAEQAAYASGGELAEIIASHA